LGYKHTEEAKRKISRSSKDYTRFPLSLDHKRSLAVFRRGKRWSKELYDTHCLPVGQYTKRGQFIKEWKSTTEAGRVLNINSGNISSCRNGNRMSAGGFIWKHINK